MPVYYVYILKCLDSRGQETLYTGSTDDLVRRVGQHQKGRGARYTKSKGLELVYFETHPSRSNAMKREYEIKTFTAEQKWALINQFQKQVEAEKSHDTNKPSF